ncbi:MAG: 3-deoxy-manno-octulosonate cytidylyltransferase [Kiritimatiellae bacterium]|nr:3-deoxy-manno-octulosonate cytidylyltransferase [Kiritimatiellia bacterium]
MRRLGVIPSRYGSTRFPGKPLCQILGKPMIQWVVEAARRAQRLDDVLVATDDARIASAVAAFGGKAVMTPSALPSGTDRVAMAAAPVGDDDIIVNIQGDEPLIDPALIDALVARMEGDSQWAMATAAAPIASLDDLEARTVVKVVTDASGAALYFSRLPIPCRRDGPPDISSGLYLRHLGIYAYRGGFLKRFVAAPPCALEKTESLEQLRALDMGAKILVLRTADTGVGVDTPKDIRRVEERLRS